MPGDYEYSIEDLLSLAIKTCLARAKKRFVNKVGFLKRAFIPVPFLITSPLFLEGTSRLVLMGCACIYALFLFGLGVGIGIAKSRLMFLEHELPEILRGMIREFESLPTDVKNPIVVDMRMLVLGKTWESIANLFSLPLPEKSSYKIFRDILQKVFLYHDV